MILSINCILATFYNCSVVGYGWCCGLCCFVCSCYGLECCKKIVVILLNKTFLDFTSMYPPSSLIKSKIFMLHFLSSNGHVERDLMEKLMCYTRYIWYAYVVYTQGCETLDYTWWKVRTIGWCPLVDSTTLIFVSFSRTIGWCALISLEFFMLLVTIDWSD